MKAFCTVLIMAASFISCTGQSKIDLEKISFSEKYTDILKDVTRLGDRAEPMSTMPVSYTYATGNYRFGTVELPASNSEETQKNTVGILLNNLEERQTKGIRIQIQNDEPKSKELLAYLTRSYGAPQVLSPVPLRNSDGVLLGYAAYWWDRQNAIFLAMHYEAGTEGRQYVSADLYAVDKQAMINPANGNESVADHLKRSYKR